MKRKIFLAAGEPSGDMHASRLAKEIKKIDPHAELLGIGGAKMEAEGVRLFYRTDDMGIIGLPDVFKHLAKIKEMFEAIPAIIDREKADLVILVDYPGFNLRLAKVLKKRGKKIFYFISPQVWAWGKSRIKHIKKYVDKILVLFKFERDMYEKAGVSVEFVGHPLLDIAKPVDSKEAIRKKYGLDESKKTIALLPGSREREIDALLPVMLEASRKIYQKSKDIQFLVVRSYNLEEGLFKKYLKGFEVPHRIVENTGCELYDYLYVSDLAVVASGTVTLECAIMNVPMIITYKVSLPTAMLMKLFIRVSSIGLVNILAGKKIVPELIQFDLNPRRLYDEASKILLEPGESGRIKKDLAAVKESLGEEGASRRSAKIITESIPAF